MKPPSFSTRFPITRFFKRTIWDTHKHDNHPYALKLVYSTLRFATIVWHGLMNNRLMSNAAALSYSMLIAFGPMIAVVVMISGFIFKNTDESSINELLNNLIGFISTPAAVTVDSTTQTVVEGASQVNPEIVNIIEELIKNAQSGAVGIVGTLLLIMISIQLIITIEKSLNIIWGVSRGRTLAQRIVFYWTFLTLGTLLGLAAIALLSASTAVQFADNLPFGDVLLDTIRWGAPVLSFLIIVLLLGSFYRFMPNTFVGWKPALFGAFVAVVLLFANKELSFLYASRMIREQSLYGSIGILPMFMLGVYVFWILILIGGQVSYALQNVATITGLRSWENTSQHTQESLCLAALVEIGKRFQNCERAPTVEQISEHLHVPQKILNICLGSMVSSGLISPVDKPENEMHAPARYQPARPLSAITLGFFKKSLDMDGNDEGMRLLNEIDPIVIRYRQWLDNVYTNSPEMNQSLEELLTERNRIS